MELQEIKSAVSRIAARYPIVSIDLFGSYASNKATDKSDIDLLVYFDEKVASLFDLIGLKHDIEDETRKNVDIVAGPLHEDSFLTIKEKVRIYGT